MIEKVKSVLLIVLVSVSLVQTYMLAYSTPNFDKINQAEYVENEWKGPQREVQDILYPENMVLHMGNGRHTVLYPGSNFYKIINQVIKQRNFAGLQTIVIDKEEWETYRNKQPGVELRFASSLSMQMLQSILRFSDNYGYNKETFDRIWITMDHKAEKVRTFIFSGSNPTVYEAINADLTVKDVETFVGFGELLPKYERYRESLYIPTDPLNAVQIKYSYRTTTPEQLQKSLFVDPGITRNLRERDGTEIYTDGKRGLQVKQEEQWMIYSDPSIAQSNSYSEDPENLMSTVKFINQHGGWSGQYMLESALYNPIVEGQTFVFRQYISTGSWALPVVSDLYHPFGYMKVVLQKGVVSNYERSLMLLESMKRTNREIQLPYGEQLKKTIEASPQKDDIASVFPAYRSDAEFADIVLTPVWAARLENGDVILLDENES